MSKTKRWIIPDIDPEKALRISEELNVSMLASKVLCARNFNLNEARDFLLCDEKCFHSPFMLHDMDKGI